MQQELAAVRFLKNNLYVWRSRGVQNCTASVHKNWAAKSDENQRIALQS
jgi:hypothetical protein